MLELLTSSLFVAICNMFVIDLIDIGESVNDESSQEHSIRNFIALNGETCEVC